MLSLSCAIPAYLPPPVNFQLFSSLKIALSSPGSIPYLVAVASTNDNISSASIRLIPFFIRACISLSQNLLSLGIYCPPLKYTSTLTGASSTASSTASPLGTEDLPINQLRYASVPCSSKISNPSCNSSTDILL